MKLFIFLFLSLITSLVYANCFEVKLVSGKVSFRVMDDVPYLTYDVDGNLKRYELPYDGPGPDTECLNLEVSKDKKQIDVQYDGGTAGTQPHGQVSRTYKLRFRLNNSSLEEISRSVSMPH